MKASISTLSPNSYSVTFDAGDYADLETLLRQLRHIEQSLAQAGYLPTGELPRTPEGLPICVRHQTPMREREKQGDTWYSHGVIDPATGEKLYCKGRPGKDSPGWYAEDARAQGTPGAGGQGGSPAPVAAKPAPITNQCRAVSDAELRELKHPGSDTLPENNRPAAGDTPTAYWTFATQMIQTGKLSLEQAGQIAKAPGTWAEKAARLLS